MRTALRINSLIIRENTGNFRDFGHLEVELGPNKPCLLSGFGRNSLPNRTGNYFGGTGNFLDVTGNFQGGAGKFIWCAARRETPVFRRGWSLEEKQPQKQSGNGRQE
jgi:hypothetical protein